MEIERALNTEGWMAREELEYLASAANNCSTILEIGSWKGRSTIALAKNTSGLVYCVDTWIGSEEQGVGNIDSDALFESFLHNIKNAEVDNRVIPVRMPSKYARQSFLGDLKFDLIFIDAAHDYDSVKDDILAWQPLLRDGGILCGHDYHEAWDGVRKAVDELIPKFRVVWTIWTTEE
jgi:predicted O-methyltransferase YrrM